LISISKKRRPNLKLISSNQNQAIFLALFVLSETLINYNAIKLDFGIIDNSLENNYSINIRLIRLIFYGISGGTLE